MPHSSQLIYIHDPMCSWCWAFRPVYDELCRQLRGRLEMVRLLGGLAPDSDEPMPASMRNYLQETWRHIQQRVPGTPFNFEFWQHCEPRRSTWPACRAVIAARALDPASEPAMIDAIQRAYYLQARNPSDLDTLTALASEIGLDGRDFAAQIGTTDTQQKLDGEIAAARRIGANQFPSLRLSVGGQVHTITVDYRGATPMLAEIRASANT